MKETADYLALIPPEHAGKPKFTATVGLSVDPIARIAALIASIPAAFDIDFAVGVQLDIVGQWVGRSRSILVPLTGLFFSFDDAALGFDQGTWKGPYDTEFGITRLNDDDYRRLLKAIVLANVWDGTALGAQAILNVFFDDPATKVFVDDKGESAYPSRVFAFDSVGRGFDEGEWKTPYPFSFDDTLRGFDTGVWQNVNSALGYVDMAMTVGVSGKRPPLVYLALLGEGLIPIKPAGVRIDYAVTSVDGSPLFGFDVDNDYLGGFDRGAWGVQPY